MPTAKIFIEGARFFGASLVSMVLDLSIASLVLWTTKSPYLGCILGSLCGMVLLYCIHARWTFVQTTHGVLSLRQFLQFATSSWLIIAVRLGFLALCAYIFPPKILYQNLELITACGLSFCVNFVLSKWLIFRAG